MVGFSLGKETVINLTQYSTQMSVPENEWVLSPFYWQITMAEPVLPFPFHSSRICTSGFLKLKKQISTLLNIQNSYYYIILVRSLHEWFW